MARRVRWHWGGKLLPQQLGHSTSRSSNLHTDSSYQDSASNTGSRGKLRQVSQKWTRNGPVDRKLRHDLCGARSPFALRISTYRSPGWGSVRRCRGWQPMATDGNGSWTILDHPGPSWTILVNLPAWGVPRACQWPQQCIFCSSHCLLPAREAEFPTSAQGEILESRGKRSV